MIRMILSILILFLLITTLAKGENGKMSLNLKYPPTPEFSKKHAELAVIAVKKNENIDLDYSPQSLKLIDSVIQGFREEGLTEDNVAETIFVFGCYAGEVLVKNNKGKWHVPKDILPEKITSPFRFMVVQLSSGAVWNPIDKGYKQLKNGSEDSFEYFYTVVTSEP